MMMLSSEDFNGGEAAPRVGRMCASNGQGVRVGLFLQHRHQRGELRVAPQDRSMSRTRRATTGACTTTSPTRATPRGTSWARPRLRRRAKNRSRKVQEGRLDLPQERLRRRPLEMHRRRRRRRTGTALSAATASSTTARTATRASTPRTAARHRDASSSKAASAPPPRLLQRRQKFRRGAPCRAQANSCDIAEECSGVFGWCPPT